MKVKYQVMLFVDGLGTDVESKEARDLVESLKFQHTEEIELDICLSDTLAMSFQPTDPMEGFNTFLWGLRSIRWGVKRIEGLLLS